MTIRILLVDDHRIFREALRSLLDKTINLSVVGEAGDGKCVMKLARELTPDIVCMDIGMPEFNGIKATHQLLAAFPAIKVIALSTHTDQVFVRDMLQAGASAYVSKAEGGKELLRAIDAVNNNRRYLCPTAADALTSTMGHQKKKGSFTSNLGARELQVLGHVVNGLTSAQIAVQLGITAGTVDVHRRNIMRKLDVRNAVELTRFAITAGLVAD